MKHVREDLPDVQVRRPEVSAALAAVLDRMTAKDLERRYPTRRRSWPTSRRRSRSRPRAPASRPARRPPSCARCRRPPAAGCRSGCATRCRWLADRVLLLAVGASRRRAPAPGGRRPHRARHRRRATIKAPAGEQVVSRQRTSASDYDPLGDDEEHADEAPLAVDQDPGTTWTTESYSSGLEGANKAGVGHLRRRQAGRRGAADRDRDARARLAGGDLRRRATAACPRDRRRLDAARRRHRAQSDAPALPARHRGERYRYYLVWITELPPGEERVEISELALFQRNASVAARTRGPPRSARVALERERRAGGRRARGHGTPLASHSFG